MPLHPNRILAFFVMKPRAFVRRQLHFKILDARCNPMRMNLTEVLHATLQ
jgi:hypothetical protein